MKSLRMLFTSLFVCTIFLSIAQTADAHRPSDAYLRLTLDDERISGRLDVALRDLDRMFDLDADGNEAITWRELSSKKAEIFDYAHTHLSIQSGTSCRLASSGFEAVRHSDGMYGVVRFDVECASKANELTIDYRLFFDRDPSHRGFLSIDYNGGDVTSFVFSPDETALTAPLRAPPVEAHASIFRSFVREGVWHVLIGFDHVLFLIALLLPAVLRPGKDRTEPAPAFSPVFFEVLKIVSAFTLAHSITLTLATLQLLNFDSAWIEAGIALSVVVAALDNLYPIFGSRRWLVAFGLGLLHGFGFSNVLLDLGLPSTRIGVALFGFNVGVELGQLAIVAFVLPLAFRARNTVAYRRFILIGGSVVIAIVAGLWTIERTLAISERIT